MLILAVESSAKTVSVALADNDHIIAETFINTKQTHSETLMPILKNIIDVTGKKISDVNLFAVSHGPGSFTGVRIGISCIKGMAFSNETPVIGISTLEAIAYGGTSYEGKEVCAVMDARRNQVYNANFEIRNGAPVRLCDDRAISIAELSGFCTEKRGNLVLLGDGAKLCYETFSSFGAILPPENMLCQRASAVAAAAYARCGESISAEDLNPIYLRMPQAERELKKKTGDRV